MRFNPEHRAKGTHVRVTTILERRGLPNYLIAHLHKKKHINVG